MGKRLKLITLMTLALLLTIAALPTWFNLVFQSTSVDWGADRIQLLVPTLIRLLRSSA
jgi:hypothetical protein